MPTLKGEYRSQPVSRDDQEREEHPKTPAILLVEDDMSVAKDVEEILKRLGYNVTGVAASGLEAIARALEVMPDLVLMDIRLMGRMNATETANEIRRMQNVPVIYLTARCDTRFLERTKTTFPSFGYVLEPFDERKLHLAIEATLYRQKMEQRLSESEGKYRRLFETSRDAIFEKGAPATQRNTLHGRETVLFAEDNTEVRAVLSEVLREFHYRVIECSDGEDAIQKFRKHLQEIDLAILDIVMPKQTGNKVYEEIRKLQKDLPVIFMSGYNEEAIQNKGISMEEGPVFMTKPVMLYDLLGKVREILDSRERNGYCP